MKGDSLNWGISLFYLEEQMTAKKTQEGSKKAPEVEETDAVEEEQELKEGQPGKDWKNIAGEDKDGKPFPPIWVKGGTEEYHMVIFSERMTENETVDVQLTVNGETLQIERGKEVVVPERFLECARHTKYPRYKQLPNQPRKITGYVQTYVYHVMKSNVGKELYFAQKKKGDAAVKKYLEAQENKDD